MNGCGCNYWKELIKSAWGLATTSVRAVKTKDETKYPDGDGLIDLSDIAGGEGTVTSVNGKQPDAQGNVAVGSADISTPDGTVQGDIETLGANLASEISARASGDEALQSAVDGKQDALTSAQQAAVDSGITKDKVTSFSMTTQNLTRLSNRVDILEGDITTAEGNIETLGTQIGTVDTKVDGKQDKLTAGANVQITGNTISATDTKYTLPTASSTVLGGVKVGTGLTITDGVLNATGTTAGVSSVNGKTGAVTIGASDVLSTAQLNAANSGITTSKVSTYDGYSTSKQDKLSTAQLNAANSGITASKVTTYDGYATGKQDKLTAGTNITISSDNVISATGGGGTAGVTSFNTKTGAITQAIDTLTAFTATSSQLRLNKTRYNADGTSKADYVPVPVVTDSSYGVVSPSMKQKWDAKADASTVTQIQTAVGGCFNDASITGNKLILGTVGGQQNTLTLPGGSTIGASIKYLKSDATWAEYYNFSVA